MQQSMTVDSEGKVMGKSKNVNSEDTVMQQSRPVNSEVVSYATGQACQQ